MDPKFRRLQDWLYGRSLEVFGDLMFPLVCL